MITESIDRQKVRFLIPYSLNILRLSSHSFSKEKPPIADSQVVMINTIATQVADGLKEKFKPLTKKENTFGLAIATIVITAMIGGAYFILEGISNDINDLEDDFQNLNDGINDIKIENIRSSNELKIALNDYGYELKNINSELQSIKENISDEKK